MTKYLLLLLLLSCNHRQVTKVTPPPPPCDCWADTAFHVQGVTCILKDSGQTDPNQNNLINPINERAIKDTFIDWGDGSVPGMYWLVEYDYGKPAPDEWQIMRWVLGDSMPRCFNEWRLEMKDINNSGPQDPEYFYDHKLFSVYCPNHRSKLQKYSEDIYITASKIEVIYNKDTMNKYMKIEYPYPDDPLRTRRDKH